MKKINKLVLTAMTLLISLINNSEIKGAMPTPSSLQEEKIKLAKAIAKAIRKDEKIDLVDQNYNNFNALRNGSANS